MSESMFDRVIRTISPQWALRRAVSSAALRSMTALNASRNAYRSRIRQGHDSRINTLDDDFTPIIDESDEIAGVRSKAINAYLNHGMATSIIERAVANIVGNGPRLRVESLDEGYNERASARMLEWWDNEADITGRLSFLDICTHLVSTVMVQGDIGTVRLKSGHIQLVEGEHIATPYEYAGRTDVVDGVYVGPFGRALAYYVVSDEDDPMMRHVAVDAANMQHWARRARPSHVRGLSVLAPVLDKLDLLDYNIDAVVTASEIAACFALLIKTEQGFAFANQAGSEASGLMEQDFEPGMIARNLGPNESVEQVRPEHPAQNWPQFMRFLIRFCGAPVGLPLELVLLDFSEASYSSAHAALEQAYRGFRRWQSGLNRQLVQLHRWRLDAFNRSGELGNVPADWDRVTWRMPGWPYLDLLKEIKGASLAVANGFRSRTDVIDERGESTFAEVVAKLAQEQEVMDGAGVPRLVPREMNALGEAGTGGGSFGESEEGGETDGDE